MIAGPESAADNVGVAREPRIEEEGLVKATAVADVHICRATSIDCFP